MADEKTKKKTSCSTMLFALIFIPVIAIIIINVLNSEMPETNTINTATKARNVEDVKLKSNEKLTKLGYEKNKTVENYYFLIETDDFSKENLELIAKKSKAMMCQMSCNISLYDDKEAYNIEQEINQLANQSKYQKADSLETKNQQFLAEHIVGFLGFEDDWFIHYPNKQ